MVYALVGIATAFMSYFFKDFVPDKEFIKIGSESVGNILSILATSMLAVATFSLSVMVTAYGNISSSATPRASRLVVENQDAQRAVATFIGAFLYSIVGIIALTISAYGSSGRFVLFLVTIAVVIVIVVTLIRWVDQLGNLGRVGQTIAQIEKETERILESFRLRPRSGASPQPVHGGRDVPLCANRVGYFSFVDVPALDQICREAQIKFDFVVRPGSYLYPGRVLGYLDRPVDEAVARRILDRILIEKERTFEQDARYGFIVLSEIGSRALSPGVNDPGTAIEVLGSAVRLLNNWVDLRKSHDEAKSEDPTSIRVYVPWPRPTDVMEDVFARIARDGASLIEIQSRVQRSLAALAHVAPEEFAVEAKRLSRFALAYAEIGLKTEIEKNRIRDWAAEI